MSSSSRSGRGGGGGGGNNNGVPSVVPQSSKKLIQSLKEIVNFPEQEIYAMLKECNMDPDETAQRLLSLDSFHEVKSKREKKKEIKDTSDSRPRAGGYASNRGLRAGGEYNTGRSSSTTFSTTEPGTFSGKHALKKDHKSQALPSSSVYASPMAGTGRLPQSFSDVVAPGSKAQTLASSDGPYLSSAPSPGLQPAWVGVPGQLSMADIVKMGRPHHKASTASTMSTEVPHSSYGVVASDAPHRIKHPPVSASLSAEPHNDLPLYSDSSSKSLHINHKADIAARQHDHHDEWSMVEQLPTAGGSSFLEPSGSEMYSNPDLSSNSHFHRGNQNVASRSEEAQAREEDESVDNLKSDSIASASGSSRQIHESNFGSRSHLIDDSYSNMAAYQSHAHASDPQEGIITAVSQSKIPNYSVEDASVAVSSVAANLQQLSIQEELSLRSAEDNPAVRIPSHLQVQSANCSHLSFGSFGSGVNATPSGALASASLKRDLEEAVVTDDASDHYHSRNPEQYGEAIRSASNSSSPRINDGAGSFNASLMHPDTMKHENSGPAHGHQYAFSSTAHDHTFEERSNLNSQTQNAASFLGGMQSYTDSLPSNVMTSTVQSARDSDIPYSAFPVTHTIPTMYNTPASSISGPTISMLESGNQGVTPSPQAMQHNLPSASIATGPAYPPQLTMNHHPHSSPSLPLGNYANMLGYSFLPQSYTYVPSAFQQAYVSNSAYNQTPSAVNSSPGINYALPQYKNSGSLSSMPQSAAGAAGYGGGLGSMTNTPGNFLLNRLASPESATISYEDLISSQYKDGNNFVIPIQNESSATWMHGGTGGSRTAGSALPPSAYYNLQGMTQQHSGYRTASQEQPSQHHGGGLAGGYSNFYNTHSPVGGTLQEHHMQMSNEGNNPHSGLQNQPSNKQLHQLWRHNY